VNHAELQSLLGAFAIDGVDHDEADAVHSHLAECPRCRAEVAEHRETAAMLASVGAAAPDRLWGRIASALEEPPPPMQLAPLRRKQQPWTRARAARLAAAAAVAVLLGALSLRVNQLNHQVAGLHAPLQHQGIDEAALAASADPAGRRVTLHAGAGPERADTVVLPDGHGYLLRAVLPSLPASMTYQLWGVVGGHTKVSLGLLGPAPTVTAFRLDPAKMSLLAITAEQAGGVATTDNPAIVSAALS